MIIMNRIKELRTQRKITQEELGNIINVQKAAVSKYELGRAVPSTDVLTKLANYFNVSVDYLLDRTDEPQGTGFQRGDNGGSQNDGEREKIPPHRKDYMELHRLIDELPHKDVEELLNTALFKKRKAEHLHEHVDDPDDF